MKKIKITFFASILLGLIGGYYYITIYAMNYYYYVDYARGIELKYEKLRKIKENKIVVAGGSNVNFGLDGDRAEEELGIPVVNTGIQAAVGTRFMLEPLKKYLKKGDTLVIAREYINGGLYVNGTEPSVYFLYIPQEIPSIFNDLTQTKRIMYNLTVRSQENFKRYSGQPKVKELDELYSYQNFKNDNFRTYYGTKLKKDKMLTPIKLEKGDFTEYFKKYGEALKKRGVKVYFSMPASLKDEFVESDILKWYEDLSAETGIPLLSKKTNTYPLEKMYDTAYHLNAIGKKERTEHFVEDIRVNMEGSRTDLNEKSNIDPNNKISSQSEKEWVVTPLEMRPQVVQLNNFNRIEKVGEQEYKVAVGKNDFFNYARFRIENQDLNKHSVKLILKGDEKLLKNIGYTSFDREDWDEIIIENGIGTYIKNNIRKAYNKNSKLSFVGFYVKNIENFIDYKVKVEKLEISQEDYDLYPKELVDSFELKQGEQYFIQPLNKDVDFYGVTLVQNEKYIVNYSKEGQLEIRDFYTGGIKKIETKEVPKITNENGNYVRIRN